MSKQQSIIERFTAAYGTLILLPNSEQKTAGGMEIPVADAELPSGIVVAVGKVPREFRSHGLKIGSTAYYARVTSSQIPLTINGRTVKCKAILWSDLRGWAPAADELPAGLKIPNERSFPARIWAYIVSVGASFALGFGTGVLATRLYDGIHAIKSRFQRKRTPSDLKSGRSDSIED